MHFQFLFTTALLSTTASANVLGFLQARQSNNTEETYLDTVCFPNTTSPVIPPCQSIINIQSACTPNGTSSLDLLAHAECMCGGSFFSDWIGCLDCDYVHGGRSPQVVSAFNTIITSVSNALCTGTPTADFADLFSSANDAVVPTGTDTVTTDLYPSQTAISLYYTPTGKQGVGAITGIATAATKVESTTTSAGTTSSQATGSGTAATTSSSSTSTSKAGAAQTQVWMGALGVVGLGMGMVAL